ncbi:MAG: 5-methyltetrahydropteroyltriglutamate--homocysteine S-methyltransferase [Sporomusaceae bacterium]|nr:5-methyltetrahydropteroyltriglutamate--homocysteine S-methyltransferase [Sporomusaceae bacterium]
MHTLDKADKHQPPFKADQVGSLLRPAALKQARLKLQQGIISKADLRRQEDSEIKTLVEQQQKAGLKAVTDGELRRSWWHLDFLWGLDGVKRVAAEQGSIAFHGQSTKAETIEIEGKIDFSSHPFLADFSYLQAIKGDSSVKFTIPSPTMLHLITTVRKEDYQPIALYKDNNAALLRDIAAAYKKAIAAFYAAGCRYLQLDDTSWGELCSAEKRQAYEKRGFDLKQLARDYVALVNASIADRPADMTISMHICRGNFRSTWFSSGGYEPVAETLFGSCRVDAFFLEYDSERAGDFRPLRHIKDQQVVLGLITSKNGELEDKRAIKERIAEAAQYVDINQLCLSPQCGFSSTEEGNLLSEEQQWAKLRLVADIAGEVWGRD